MRSNLALADSYSRMGFVGPSNGQNPPDLGLLGLGPGEEQRKIQNESVLNLIVALLYPALENYFEMKRFKAGLEDLAIESFLDGQEDRQQFTEGMRVIRNHSFHIYRLKHWERNALNAFGKACEQGGGVLSVMQQLLGKV